MLGTRMLMLLAMKLTSEVPVWILLEGISGLLEALMAFWEEWSNRKNGVGGNGQRHFFG